MSDDSYAIAGIELTDDHYTVTQSWVRNKFTATDSAGNVVLKGKQKMLKLKEEFPFVDGEGNDVFTVKAASIIDVAGNYVLTDAQTGKDVIILDNDYSIMQDTWTIRDADTEAAIAKIESRGALTTLARNSLPFGNWIPHKYEITDAQGNHVGRIHGQISLRDTYEVTIDDASDVPKEAVVAAAMVIDAIQDH